MRTKLFIGLIAMTAGLIFLTTVTASAATKEPIKIGYVADLTSYLSLVGQSALKGVDLRFSETQTVGGRPLQLVVEDDASDPDQALDKTRKLIERDKVSMVIGSLNAGCVIAMAPYLDKMSVPGIVWSPQADQIATLSQSYFLATGLLRQFSYAAGAYAAEQGYKTAVTVGMDFVAGYEYIDGFKQAFEQRGGKVIQQRWVPMTATEFSPYILGLQKADVTAIWIVGSAMVPFWKQYGKLRKEPIIDVYSELDFPANFQQIASVAHEVNATTFDSWIWTDPNKGSKQFADKFKQKYGEFPSHMGLLGYDSASIVITALEATGGDTSYAKLKDALYATKMSTPYGPRWFNSDRIGLSVPRAIKVEKQANEYVPKVVKTYNMISKVEGKKIVVEFAK